MVRGLYAFQQHLRDESTFLCCADGAFKVVRALPRFLNELVVEVESHDRISKAIAKV